MATPQAGRKRFRGILEGYADGEVRLFIDNPEGGAEKLSGRRSIRCDIGDAKLVLTDALDCGGPPARCPARVLATAASGPETKTDLSPTKEE